MTRTVDFDVTGEQKLHCAACERRVGNALRRLPGVRDVRASFQTQHVQVRIDATQVDPEQLRARLEQLGYEVTLRGGGA